MKIEFWWRQIFEILIIHKPYLWSRDVPQKIWVRSVQPFWRLLDTSKQTDERSRLDYWTRQLGRFAPIFHFHCGHVIFLNMVKQNKKFCGFYKRSVVDFPWSHARSQKKFGYDRFSRFYVYWIQTSRQTSKVFIYSLPPWVHFIPIILLGESSLPELTDPWLFKLLSEELDLLTPASLVTNYTSCAMCM